MKFIHFVALILMVFNTEFTLKNKNNNMENNNEIEIEEILKKILGEDAFSNMDMNVSKETSKLVKAVDYLISQIKITGNMINDKKVSEHIKSVINTTKDILNNN